jgi:hypothetical protein
MASPLSYQLVDTGLALLFVCAFSYGIVQPIVAWVDRWVAKREQGGSNDKSGNDGPGPLSP